jgi:hypothetical protein
VRLELVINFKFNDFANFAIKTFQILLLILYYIHFLKSSFTYLDKDCKLLCTQKMTNLLTILYNEQELRGQGT